MVALWIGGRKSVAVAALMVSATLMISMLPTKAGQLAEAEGIKIDCEIEGEGEHCGEIIMLEDFAGPQHKWVEMNDPVMGGKSTGSFSWDQDQKLGVFHGSVEIVSFLNAPGFIKAETTKGEPWPDVSSCEGLRFVLKSSTPTYEGFRVSFGKKRPPGAFPYTYGFKANMELKQRDGNFQTVKIPFDQFTDKWDPGTGDPVVTCAENQEFCPDEASKKDLFSIAVWGEGVKGEVDLEIESVAAYGCKTKGYVGSIENHDSDGDGSAYFAGDSDNIAIEDFSNPVHEWRTMNDPVMGGKSTSSLTIGPYGTARFEGTCAIVPFLHAPGFITMTTGVHIPPGGGFLGRFGRGGSSSPLFPDVSSCEGLKVVLRSTVDYEGYYMSFGTDRVPGGHHAMGYKTHLDIGASEAFAELSLPFSDFSSKWDDATGKTTVTCQEDPKYCPSPETLRDMKTISIWGEGVEGRVDLEIQYIGAYGCASGYGGMTSQPMAAASLQGGSSGFSSSSSPMLGMVALCAAFVFGLVLISARRNRNVFSRDSSRNGYVEVDTAEISFA